MKRSYLAVIIAVLVAVAIVTGRRLHQPPAVNPAELAAAKKVSDGKPPQEGTSDNAQNPAEAMPETAGILPSNMPDSPVLATSEPADSEPTTPDQQGVAVLLRLQRLMASAANAPRGDVPIDPKQSREILEQAAAIAREIANSQLADQIAQLSAALMLQRGRQCMQSRPDGTFFVPGTEDAEGVNWKLRGDLAEIGQDAEQFKVVAQSSAASEPLLAPTQFKLLRLIGGYYAYIAGNWRMTDGTRKIFEETRNQLAASLPVEKSALAVAIMQTDLKQLEQALTADGEWKPQPDETLSVLGEQNNPYLGQVDAEIQDLKVRAAIRRVQPACVRVGTASGVTMTADGCVLTAAHVVHELNIRSTVLFPDGRKYLGNCIAIDKRLDLALCKIHADGPVPYARLAISPPIADTPVVCVGQPGSATPEGELTGYEPFHVSIGHIVGFREDQLDDQRLGGTKHDAWTYWGHSGSPLFNEQGELVALHNSWDPHTRTRHAVMHEIIAWFLKENLPNAGR